jgi:hypothetical protein
MVLVFYLSSIYVLKAWGGFGWATREEMGPNDASGGRCFFIYKCYLFYFIFIF